MHRAPCHNTAHGTAYKDLTRQQFAEALHFGDLT